MTNFNPNNKAAVSKTQFVIICSLYDQLLLDY